MRPATLAALAAAAEAFAQLARQALEEGTADPGELVPLVEAARIGGTSVSVVKRAIRAGEVTGYGGQRDRSVRRGELEVWIESRRTKPIAGPSDPDLARRVLRLAEARRRAGRGKRGRK
jgi:hypothetical protein